MAHAYYDETMGKAEAQRLLSSLSAQIVQKRPNGSVVYSVRGGGQALVSQAGARINVKLYRGECPC